MNTEISYYSLTFLKLALISTITFLSPIKGFLIIISLAVGFDTLFAIYTTIKLNGWKSYQSTKLFNIVVKTFFYMGTIVFAYLIDYFMIEKNLIWGIPNLITKITTMLWIYIEMKSWDETSQKLGNPPFLTIVNNIIKKAKTFKKDLNELKKDE
ncbi:holin family protein [Flavobacterium aquaticum]|uniref:Holin family protein n=1 Tax=Flavobacterium aquaticum TaxID=1236486 RepID=A0A327YM47_9FLAO|nr:phage holin family protein [Flavobacterium aquaticum]RAK21611.1 holin family protein [Flavobacterium aquaticum]